MLIGETISDTRAFTSSTEKGLMNPSMYRVVGTCSVSSTAFGCVSRRQRTIIAVTLFLVIPVIHLDFVLVHMSEMRSRERVSAETINWWGRSLLLYEKRVNKRAKANPTV